MTVHSFTAPESLGDAAYEDFRERCDLGTQCPTCRLHIPVRREIACGVDLFACCRCNARWFDLWTRPEYQ